MDGKYLGKIKSVRFGLDTDEIPEDPRLTLFTELSFDGRGTSLREYNLERIASLLLDAQTDGDIMRLAGRPIEVTVAGNVVVDWRILTEVL